MSSAPPPCPLDDHLWSEIYDGEEGDWVLICEDCGEIQDMRR